MEELPVRLALVERTHDGHLVSLRSAESVLELHTVADSWRVSRGDVVITAYRLTPEAASILDASGAWACRDAWAIVVRGLERRNADIIITGIQVAEVALA